MFDIAYHFSPSLIFVNKAISYSQSGVLQVALLIFLKILRKFLWISFGERRLSNRECKYKNKFMHKLAFLKCHISEWYLQEFAQKASRAASGMPL